MQRLKKKYSINIYNEYLKKAIVMIAKRFWFLSVGIIARFPIVSFIKPVPPFFFNSVFGLYI